MKPIAFSATSGFYSIDVQPWLEELNEWLPKIGFQTTEVLNDGLESTRQYDDALCYLAAPENTEWHALMLVSSSDWIQPVLVPTAGDLIELRLKLLPITTNALLHRLDDLCTGAERLFRAHHGHSIAEVCDRCDPIGYANQRARWKREKERLAERPSP